MPTSEARRSSARRVLRRLLLLAIALLYALSIPWYAGEAGPEPRLLGLPRWAGVALACYVAVAVLNSLAWLLTDIPDAPDASDPDETER